jgi:glycosyltransferase involved in cell wall biosynthesis
MKILHVTPRYHPCVGGAESYTKELSERLAQRGHAVTVLTMNESSQQADRRSADTEVLNGVTVRRFAPAGKLHGLLSTGARTSVGQRVLGLTCRLDTVDLWARSPYGFVPALHAVRTRPDVVAVINWYGGWLPYQLCLARRLRHFALVGVPLFHTEIHWARAPVQEEMLHHCDAVVAMTEHERTFMASVTDKAHAIGVGVDPAAFLNADGRSVRSRYGIGEAPLVGYIGRMDPAKGIDVLIRAMQSVWRVVPNARLLLAGGAAQQSGGPLGFPSPALDSLSAAERSRVIISGRFSDDEKPSLYDALDVFAMPSLAESFGIAYLEAWMRKKPVIGARLGATEFVIDDGTDGELVTPGNSDELAAAICNLLGDRDRRLRLGSKGHSKTLSRFTWDKITDAVERLYRQLHERPGPQAILMPDTAAAANSNRESM